MRFTTAAPGLIDVLPGLEELFPGLLLVIPGLPRPLPGSTCELPGAALVLSRPTRALERSLRTTPALTAFLPRRPHESPALMRAAHGFIRAIPGAPRVSPAFIRKPPGLSLHSPCSRRVMPGLHRVSPRLTHVTPDFTRVTPGLARVIPELSILLERSTNTLPRPRLGSISHLAVAPEQVGLSLEHPAARESPPRICERRTRTFHQPGGIPTGMAVVPTSPGETRADLAGHFVSLSRRSPSSSKVPSRLIGTPEAARRTPVRLRPPARGSP